MILRAGDEPIPGYRLEAFLGQGQFGQVWKARSPGKAFCALKFLDLSGKQGRKEFRAIQRVKEIRHAHLMPITALWLLDEEGNVLNDAAMEGMGRDSTLVDKTLAVPNPDEPAKPALLVVAQLLGDKTLGDRLEESTREGHEGIPVEELLTYMEEAAKGVDYLNSATHDLGSGIFAIQHCDIKPANILLAGDSVLICDYGVAQALADSDRQARATGMVGSPAYMAPECIAQQPSQASDQYSLAVTYYELRTGALPFSKTTFAEVIDSHREGKLDLSKLTPAERKVIQKATSVDPKRRYGSTVEMVHHLRIAALGESQPPTKWRLVLVASSVVLLLGFLLGGYLAKLYGWGATAERTILVVMEPATGELAINGELQSLGADGTVAIECPPDAQLEIVATSEPEFLETRQSIHVASITDETLHVKLNRDPKFFAERSRNRLNSGDFDGAVAEWAKAISHGASGDFSTIPSPDVQMPEFDDGILAAGSSPDLSWMGTVGNQGALRLWKVGDLSLGEPLSPLNLGDGAKPHSLAISNRWAVLSFQDGNVSIVDLSVNPPAERHSFNVQDPPIDDEFHKELIELVISPDERWLITTSSDAGSLTETLVHAWDLNTDSPKTSKTLIGRHEASISAITFDANSTEVTTASWDGTVRSWPVKLPIEGVDRDSLLATYSSEVYCLVQGRSMRVFGGEGSLVRDDVPVDADSENRLTVFRSDWTVLPVGHSAPIDLLSLSPSERWLASGCEESELYVWETTTEMQSPIVLRGGHRGQVHSVCFSRDEQWMISGGEDGQVLLWDFQNRESPGPLRLKTSTDPVFKVIVDGQGERLIAFAKSGIRVWGLRRCALVKRACDNAGVAPTPAEESESSLVDA